MTGFCIFGEEMFFLEIVLKTKYLCLALGMWECSSVAEQSTAEKAHESRFFVVFRFIL